MFSLNNLSFSPFHFTCVFLPISSILRDTDQSRSQHHLEDKFGGLSSSSEEFSSPIPNQQMYPNHQFSPTPVFNQMPLRNELSLRHRF